MAPEHPLRPIDWDGDHIRLLDQTLGLLDEVTLLGWQDQQAVREQPAGADAFFLPSLSEGIALADPDRRTRLSTTDPARVRDSFDLARRARVFAEAYRSLSEA